MIATPGTAKHPSYPSARLYNAAHPHARMPHTASARQAMRSYTCAGTGVDNDIVGDDTKCILEFLPGGAPRPHEQDRIGTVVASRWGNPPYLVLAERISLRQAWTAIASRCPAALSAAAVALDAFPPRLQRPDNTLA